MTGILFDIKEMAVHDGPGLRTSVFLKGCPLRCVWCHNPEGLSPKPQLYFRKNACRSCGLCRRGCSHPDCQPYGRCLHICPQGLLSVSGYEITADELAARLEQSLDITDGVTFSGGEPLLQAEFLLAVIDRLPGVHFAIETSGHAAPSVFARVLDAMDFVYMDLKLADPALHKKYTGADNRLILENLQQLRRSGIPCAIRTPLIPGITDTPENLAAIEALTDGLPWEQLSYNAMAGAKYPMLDMAYPYDQL